MTDPKTISITPDPSYIKKAFEHFGIELGGALRMTPTGDFTIDTDAPDFPDVMSKLTGQLLADYATGTMVIPSNVQSLQGAHRALGELSRIYGIRMGEGAAETLSEAVESLESVIGNLDGLLGPTTS